jgi:uncharacterized membrane protein (DUF106 family)
MMTGLFSCIFIFSLILGFGYGWMNEFSGFQLLVCTSVSGFLGSCVVAILFTYLYFTHVETDKERIKRLKHEITQFKKKTSIK